MPAQFKDIAYNATPRAPNLYHYLPLRADLDRDMRGKARISLTQVGSTAHLMFATNWQADLADLDTLRSLLSARAAQLEPVQLSFVDLGTPVCRVLVGDGKGNFREIATSGTSGYPPFHSVFNLALDADATERAHAALRGERHWLAFEYAAQAHVPLGTNGRLRIDVGRLARWLDEQGWTAGDPIGDERIEAATDAGLIEIMIRSEGAAGADGQALRARLMRRVDDVLTDQLGQVDAAIRGTIQIEIHTQDLVAEPVRVFADIGALVAPAIH